jgi:hypothetical protein
MTFSLKDLPCLMSDALELFIFRLGFFTFPWRRNTSSPESVALVGAEQFAVITESIAETELLVTVGAAIEITHNDSP